MSNSLNEIVKSILKLSNIFYTLSNNAIIKQAAKAVAIKDEEDKEEKILNLIKMYKNVFVSILLDAKNKEEYLKEFEDTKTKDRVNLRELVLDIDRLVKLCDSILSEDHVGLQLFFNKIKEDIVEPINEEESLPLSEQTIIDTNFYDEKIGLLFHAILENPDLRKEVKDVASGASTFFDQNTAIEDALKKEFKKDKEISDVLSDYASGQAEEDFAEMQKIFKETREIEAGAQNIINYVMGDVQNISEKSPSKGNVTTPILTLRQKADTIARNNNERISQARASIDRWKRELSLETDPKKIEKIEKIIKEKEKIIELLRDSQNLLNERVKIGEKIDKAYQDLELPVSMEEKVEEFKKKYSEILNTHKEILKRVNNVISTSLERALSLGKLDEIDYKWMKSIGIDDANIDAIKKLSQFFIQVKQFPQNFPGEEAGQFRKEFPEFCKQIAKQKINKETILSKVNLFIELKEKIDTISKLAKERKSLIGKVNNEVRNNIKTLKEELKKEKINVKSFKDAYNYIVNERAKIPNGKFFLSVEKEYLDIVRAIPQNIVDFILTTNEENVGLQNLENYNEVVKIKEDIAKQESDPITNFINAIKLFIKAAPATSSQDIETRFKQIANKIKNDPKFFKIFIERIQNNPVIATQLHNIKIQILQQMMIASGVGKDIKNIKIEDIKNFIESKSMDPDIVSPEELESTQKMTGSKIVSEIAKASKDALSFLFTGFDPKSSIPRAAEIMRIVNEAGDVKNKAENLIKNNLDLGTNKDLQNLLNKLNSEENHKVLTPKIDGLLNNIVKIYAQEVQSLPQGSQKQIASKPSSEESELSDKEKADVLYASKLRGLCDAIKQHNPPPENIKNLYLKLIEVDKNTFKDDERKIKFAIKYFFNNLPDKYKSIIPQENI